MTDTSTTPGLTLGPQDPDAASGLTERLGVHNHATKLLKRHRANFPVELTIALGRPRDDARSDTLDMEEVEHALTSLQGRRAFFKEDKDVLEDASVRGTSDKDRVVSVVYRRGGEFGRSAQGVIPYAGMTASIRAYDDAVAKAEARENGLAGMSVTAPDAALDDAEARVTAATTATEKAERARREAEEKFTALQERIDRLENPEPFSGYDMLAAKERAEMVSDGGVEEYGRAGLERIRTYEEGRKQPSKMVLDAIESALTEKPAAS